MSGVQSKEMQRYLYMHGLPRERIDTWADSGSIPASYKERWWLGFGFVVWPYWNPSRGVTYYAFRSPKMNGLACSTRGRAFVHWAVDRFYPSR